jgi:hypothetical protein
MKLRGLKPITPFVRLVLTNDAYSVFDFEALGKNPTAAIIQNNTALSPSNDTTVRYTFDGNSEGAPDDKSLVLLAPQQIFVQGSQNLKKMSFWMNSPETGTGEGQLIVQFFEVEA